MLNNQYLGPLDSSHEVNLTSVFKIIKKRFGFIIVVASLITICSVFHVMLTTKYYKVDAVIMPVSDLKGGMLGVSTPQFSTLASMFGVEGGSSQSTKLLVLLETKAIAERIVDRFDLERFYFRKRIKRAKGNEIILENLRNAAVHRLMKDVELLEYPKKTIVQLTIYFPDPQLAFDIAHAYLAELQHFINNNSLTTAKRNRQFIEKQLADNRVKLLNFGKHYHSFYREKNVSSIEGMVDVPIEKGAGGLLGVLEKKEERMDGNIADVIVRNVPNQVYLNYATLQAKILSELNGVLSQQYELARIQEAREDLSFQVIDPPRFPRDFSRPKPLLIVVMTFLFSLIFSTLYASFQEFKKRI